MPINGYGVWDHKKMSSVVYPPMSKNRNSAARDRACAAGRVPCYHCAATCQPTSTTHQHHRTTPTPTPHKAASERPSSMLSRTIDGTQALAHRREERAGRPAGTYGCQLRAMSPFARRPPCVLAAPTCRGSSSYAISWLREPWLRCQGARRAVGRGRTLPDRPSTWRRPRRRAAAPRTR
jgi:hypothetical protein